MSYHHYLVDSIAVLAGRIAALVAVFDALVTRMALVNILVPRLGSVRNADSSVRLPSAWNSPISFRRVRLPLCFKLHSLSTMESCLREVGVFLYLL